LLLLLLLLFEEARALRKARVMAVTCGDDLKM